LRYESFDISNRIRWRFAGRDAWKARVLLRYLRQLDTARLVLWCYAIWYSVVFVRYFDPSPTLWLTSLGLSGIIGFALLLSTRAAIGVACLGGWGMFRLFLMPFCVSSFAALVKGRRFLLIFAPNLMENFLALSLCGMFVGFVLLLRHPSGPRVD
jgi:hypothetical protein